MSAAEEDTELRDLLVQTLENNGVLNRIKAELRAAVFLALEEQEKIENKTPLVNESLRKFLNTKDGLLVSSLFAEFLQFFSLDFTMAVYQPETNMFSGPEDRKSLARDLGIVETEGTKGAPLLLELIKRCQLKEDSSFAEELSTKQIAEAKKKFDFYDKDKRGKISKEEAKLLFMDLLPHFHKNMLERYVNDEFRAVDKDFNNAIDFSEVLGMYKRLFLHCRSVVAQDVSDVIQTPWKPSEGKPSAQTTISKDEEIPRYKGQVKLNESREQTGEQVFETDNVSLASGEERNRSILHSSASELKLDSKANDKAADVKNGRGLGLDEDDEDDEGDSFFDDPLPKQNKTYGWSSDKNGDTDEDAEDSLNETGNRLSPVQRMTESNKPTGSLASLSSAPALKSGSGSLSGAPLLKGPERSSKTAEMKDLKMINEKIGRLELGTGDEDDDYDDDFNSTSHHSDKTKSEVSIGEEIEEEISIEGEDFKLDDLTQDQTISQLSDVADYLEEVAQS